MTHHSQLIDTKPTVHIGKIIQHATLFNVKNGSEKMMNSDSLVETVTRLFELLSQREIDYLLVGGIALLQYVEGRNTEDIDLIMAMSALNKMPEIKITYQDHNFARGEFDGLRIDLLLTSNRLFDTVKKDYATRRPFVEQEIRCATVEGLLLLKLYALPSLYRQGNFARVGIYENDIASLMYSYQPDMALLFEQLAPHLSETDLVSVKEIVTEIEGRIKRFGAGT